MKSSYELAMERFGDGDGSKALTDEQKATIAETEVKYKAKIAERKIFLEKSLADALATENEGEAEEIRRQIAEEVSALEEEAEQAKEKIRQA